MLLERGLTAMKLLLFEDDAGVALLTKEALEKRGFQVEIAHGGREGLEKAQAKKYEVVILDQLMPDLTGLQVFEQLRKTNPQAVAVMVTGSGDEEIAVKAMKMGVADYIVKSPDMAYLKTLPIVLEKAVEQKKLALEKERLAKELAARNQELAIKLKTLETFEKVTMDREKRILELKEEIKKLKNRGDK